MKKSKKIILTLIPVVLVLCMMFMIGGNVFAAPTSPINANIGGTGSETVGTITNATNKIWNTVVLILQIVAVAAIVIAGIRYMFSSADTKADIKKQTIILVVGAVLVFGATTIINLIVGAVEEIGA